MFDKIIGSSYYFNANVLDALTREPGKLTFL